MGKEKTKTEIGVQNQTDFFGISKDKPLQTHQMTASVLKSQWHRETWRPGVECDCVRSTAFTCVSEASVFPISVQRPVLWRQTLPPQALNKPAQQRRERLFRTGPLQSRGQIAYLINAVMEKLEGRTPLGTTQILPGVSSPPLPQMDSPLLCCFSECFSNGGECCCLYL